MIMTTMKIASPMLRTMPSENQVKALRTSREYPAEAPENSRVLEEFGRGLRLTVETPALHT